ncbi:Eco57I restriction-modification methylase domain-containing protein [Sorangium sp. So ce1000]|uniref:Eco57I restriction-modification methylase domain-containing protein n=1 Tax=Sorangium sp. So ce1000 TaxID=3133325 RepID=UPI003F6425D8
MSSEGPQLSAALLRDRERGGASAPRSGAKGAPLGGSGPPADGVARQLRDQAQGALGELLRGFQAADPQDGDVARAGSVEERQRLRAGLVSALLRLIFLLYAEARGLLSGAPDGGAPLARLFEHLQDERRRGDDLERRHGAWARVAALFRALCGSGSAGPRGGLCDPDAHPFLETRPWLSDGALHRVLTALLVHEGAPLCYGELEVEHLGTLYEGLIAFDLEIAEGESMALLPSHVVVDLEALVALPGRERLARLEEAADLKLGARPAARVAAAGSVAELAQALARRASPRQPGPIARGALYFQRGQLRRRAGSYYTPREISSRVVERTLSPLLDRDGRPPAPEDVLSLAVCDPAMGSGAFLVEACRQLAARLVVAWERAGATPPLGPGEAPLTRAMALVAERCLYGVDLDPLAVDLARLSLWLVVQDTRLPLSFLDGNLRCGDSLIGAERAEVGGFPVAARLRGGAGQRRTRRALLRRAPAPPPSEGAERAPCDRPETAEGATRDRPEKAEGALCDRPEGAEGALCDRPEGAEGALCDRPEAAKGAPRDRPERADGVDQAALDAWMALWFWPSAGEIAALAPAPATFARYMAAAREPADPRAALSRRIAEERRFLHWELAFPRVFDRPEPGFDAVIGNPPWVAFVGRAAQPIAPEVFYLYLRRNPAFHGYRSLHGLFVHRAASLLRPGGRLGLVIPTSVSDLDGYGPTRRAHDALCAVDSDLPSFGSDAFDGVFQPCMGLLSTRLAPAAPRAAKGASWPLARSDLDLVSRRLLERLGALTPLPAALFGERGFQTTAEDVERIRRADVPEPPYTCPIREGTDVGEFIARAPRHHVDRAGVKGRFRKDEDWKAVRLLIRQTARYPIAALSDGLPFRNSILAGFCDATWSEFALLCYLNSSPVRWWHYTRHRDAREGMPQVKIAHLRAIPAPPPAGAALIAALDALGRELGPANAGLPAKARRHLDSTVASMLEMTEEERGCVARWAEATPLPRPDG